MKNTTKDVKSPDQQIKKQWTAPKLKPSRDVSRVRGGVVGTGFTEMASYVPS